MGEITTLLAQARDGDSAALDQVFALLYPELRRLARLRAAGGEHTLTPTALVHEAYMKLFGASALALNDRRHFLACAARAMRAIAIDHARRRHAVKRGGGGEELPIDEVALELGVASDEELLDLDEALRTLDRVDVRLREVVELRFFAGLEFDAIAELQDCSLRTAKRQWERARAFLHAQLAVLD